ncbi:MAG: hypothetical protein ACE5PV_15020 [Candidatus Poribacteria bacterium]
MTKPKSQRCKKRIWLWLTMVIFIYVNHAEAAPYFHDPDLVDIPSGKSLKHGIFTVGTFMAFRNEKGFPREESAVKLDFGLFNRLEISIITLKSEQNFLLSNFKLQLLKEVDVLPNVAMGIENIGDKVSENIRRYESASPYIAISKKFNLPFTHLITGHIGIGRKRYIETESIGRYLHGVFGGISKDFQPGFIDGNISLSLELDGRDVNFGARYLTTSGLLLDIALGTLNATLSEEKEMRYLLGVSFTNRMMLQKIEETSHLAKQAGKRANEALSQVEKNEKAIK